MGFEWEGRKSFVAIDWILISNCRFEIPEAFSYFVVSFWWEFGVSNTGSLKFELLGSELLVRTFLPQ